MLSRTCVALLATTLLATPVAARDKTLYIGAEAGVLWASDTDIDLVRDDPLTDLDNFLELDHKLGYDFGVIFGYDAGIVRAELDLSYKRASHDEYEFDDGEFAATLDADGKHPLRRDHDQPPARRRR